MPGSESVPAATALVWFRNEDRKSTRLNSSHLGISYAVFCLKKKNNRDTPTITAALVITEQNNTNSIGPETIYKHEIMRTHHICISRITTQTHNTYHETKRLE